MPIREKILEVASALPMAPRIFARLDKLMRNEASALNEIAVLIRGDAALTAQLIRQSNSAAYGGVQRVGSLEEAVARVGMKETYRLVGYVAGTQLTEQALKHYGIESEQLREHMLQTAFVSEQLAIQCGLDGRMAYTAGLLRPIGFFVCDRLAEQYEPVQPYSQAHDHDYRSWEGRLFGISSAEVASLVLEEWKFPVEIVEAVRRHRRPDPADHGQRMACLLNLACGLVAKHGFGLPGETGHWATPQNRLISLGFGAKHFEAAEAKALDAVTGFRQRLSQEVNPVPVQLESALPEDIVSKKEPPAIIQPEENKLRQKFSTWASRHRFWN